MTEIELRPIQRNVVESDLAHMVVVAGAGAGKTSVLVQRYLRFVQQGVSPESILCITFTRKAAAEMKGRIVHALQSAGLTVQAQEAEIGPIQTIHSFCERLLKENSLTAGLDPEFTLLSESATALLIQGAIQTALAGPPDDESVHAVLHRLTGLSATGFAGRQAGPHGRLEAILQRFLEKLRPSGLSRGELATRYESPESALAYWRTAITNQIIQDLGECPNDPFEAGAVSSMFKAARRARPFYDKGGVNAAELLEEATLTSGIVRLGCEAWRLVESEMRRLQVLDFNELESLAVKLVVGSPVAQSRLRSNFRVMMVDEAQDLNPLQSTLLKSLGIENRLYVGDPFQSIYGWRQADYELFRALAVEGPRHDLDENHRSDPGILNFIQDVFKREWGGDDAYKPMRKPDEVERPIFDDTPTTWEGVRIWRQSAKNTTRIAEKLDDLRKELGPKKSIAVLVRRSSYGAELLGKLRANGVPARLIGGTDRYYTRMEVRDVANCLRALADPYDDFALLATLRSPFAGISMDAIALLALNKPVIEQLATFASPVASDQEKLVTFLGWFQPISGWADRVPAWEVLAEVYAVSGYWEALARRPGARQALANVRKLLRLAGESPTDGPAVFAERIREIQRMNHKESDAPSESDTAGEIAILTVHKAKGLEWDAVVVPDLHKDDRPRKEDLEVDPRTGFLSTGFVMPPEGMPHLFARHRRAEREAGEASRLLYVALTRARCHLCVVAHPQAKDGSPARKLANLIGLTKEPLNRIRDESAE